MGAGQAGFRDGGIGAEEAKAGAVYMAECIGLL